MQLSEVLRPAIAVPCTNEAEESMRRLMSPTSVQHVKAINLCDELYDAMWDSGIIQAINSRLGSMIDEHETEIIEAKDVQQVLITIEHVLSTATSSQATVGVVLRAIRELAREASDLNRPLVFVL